MRRHQNQTTFATGLMTAAVRKEIHHYISLIREKLHETDLAIDKKEVLMKRLDSFAAEVNKDRTGLQALGSSFVFAMKTVGEGVKELEPVVEYIERIYKVMSKAEECNVQISFEERKKLEGPRKQLAPPSAKDMEDEIPF